MVGPGWWLSFGDIQFSPVLYGLKCSHTYQLHEYVKLIIILSRHVQAIGWHSEVHDIA